MFTNKNTKSLAAALIALALAFLACLPPGPAEIWYVATTGDDSNSCQTLTDACLTIGAAIGKASSGHLIMIASGTYTENNLVINQELFFQGAGEGSTIVDAGGGFVLFQADPGAANLNLAGMTLRNGQVALDVSDPAEVTMTNVTVEDFSAPVGNGVITNLGTLEMFSTTLRNSIAPPPPSGSADISAGSAGILNLGSLEIRDSTIMNVQGYAVLSRPGSSTVIFNALFDSNQNWAVYNYGGSLSIGSSVFENNGVGELHGGAVVNSRSDADLTMVNTSLSYNLFGLQDINGAQANVSQSTINGSDNDAIVVSDSPGLVTLTNVTISGNDLEGVDVTHGASAHLYNVTITENYHGLRARDGSSIHTTNSLVTSNSISNCHFDGSGTIISGGYNLSDDTSCGFTGPGDLSGVAAPLLPLANNGGATETHALDSNVPNLAIDGGNPAGCTDAGGAPLTIDQRGVSRPQGAFCDLGSYETEAGFTGPIVIVTLEILPINTPTPTIGLSRPIGEILREILCWVGPGNPYEVISSIQPGTQVELLGTGEGGGYLVIQNPRYSVPCWAKEDAVDTGGFDLLSLPVFKIPPLPTQTPTVVPPLGCLVPNANKELECTYPCPDTQKYPQTCTP